MPEERFAPAPAAPTATPLAGWRLPRQLARIATAAQARLARAIARRRTTAHSPAPSSQNVPQAQHQFSHHSMGAVVAPARSSRRPQSARPPASRDAAESSARGTSGRLSMQITTRPTACAHVWPAAGHGCGERPTSGDCRRHAEAMSPAGGSARRRSGARQQPRMGHAYMCYAMLCYVLYCTVCVHAHAPATGT